MLPEERRKLREAWAGFRSTLEGKGDAGRPTRRERRRKQNTEPRLVSIGDSIRHLKDHPPPNYTSEGICKAELSPEEVEAIILYRAYHSRSLDTQGEPDRDVFIAKKLNKPVDEIKTARRHVEESLLDPKHARHTEPFFSPYEPFSPLASCDHGERELLDGIEKFEEWELCPICHRTWDDNGKREPLPRDFRA